MIPMNGFASSLAECASVASEGDESACSGPDRKSKRKIRMERVDAHAPMGICGG